MNSLVTKVTKAIVKNLIGLPFTLIIVYLVKARVKFYNLPDLNDEKICLEILSRDMLKKLFNVLSGIHVSLFCTQTNQLFSSFLKNNNCLQTKMILLLQYFFFLNDIKCRYPYNYNVSELFEKRCFYLQQFIILCTQVLHFLAR